MTVNDILALTKAGFTKDDIMVLATSEGNAPKTEVNAEKGAENPTPAQTPKAENPTPAQTPKAETTEQTTQAPLMTDAQVKQLAQALNLGNASIDVPNNVTVDDKMKEHFTNLLLGKE